MKEVAERAVLLSPHIDDVPFSLGAAVLDGRFPLATVVNVFSVSQSAGDDGDVACVSAARRLEDQRFFETVHAPVERLYLDRLDAPLRLAITDDDVCCVSPPESDADEVNRIRSLLETIRPERALLVAPLGLGRHVDHVVVHRAACAAALDGWQVAFFEDLPYASDASLHDIHHVVYETASQIRRRLEPRVLFWERAGGSKIELMRAYESQLGPTTLTRIQEHGMRFGAAAERLWFDDQRRPSA